MTVRRDLEELDGDARVLRTYGGAASRRLKPAAGQAVGDGEQIISRRPSGVPLGRRLDALVTTALNPRYDQVLLEILGTQNTLPIIAESLPTHRGEPVVAVDNFQAGFELGEWAAHHAQAHWKQQAHMLDLTYYLANTQARSRGFISGVREVLPEADVILSLDAQSRFDTAYQLTKDALTVHPQINLIFAINDITAWGAIQACEDLAIDPDSLLVLPFGLEGDTLKNALQEGRYCKAGLAMFSEIVGRVCIEAAIAAYNHQDLPEYLVTPHAVLTAANLTDYYQQFPQGWRICWEKILQSLAIPLPFTPAHPRYAESMPRRIGFIVPFSEHEWYQNLVKTMREHSAGMNIEFEIVDVHQSLIDEVDLRRRAIAAAAAQWVVPGDVILIDGGANAVFLAEALLEKESITVITNAIPVFDVLRANQEIVLILTGGAFRSSSQVLVGPTAEGALRELRADKLFLNVAGVSLDFGLSHTNISEVTIKQAMIRSAREVILLADHTFFGLESTIQVAGLNVVQKLITDDALPASVRLELNKRGIQIILANT